MKKIVALVVAAAAVAAVLSVGQHLIVSGGRLKRLVNKHPEEFLVEYDRATAWVPGTLRFSNLRVRSRDANVEWEFRIPEARIDYSPLSLFSRTFRVRRLAAPGLTFRLRERQHKGAISRNVAIFPPIEGYADPPMRDPSAPPKPPPTSPPWTIRVDSLDADPSPLIWIGPWRYEGDARVSGGFSLQPGWRADVGPATIEFRKVGLSMGKDAVLTEAHGVARARIQPFDPRQVKGSQVWPFIDGEFSLEGAVVALDFFRHVVDEKDAPRFRKGRGRAGVHVTIERGVGKGNATLEATGIEARTSGGDLRGALTARAEIPRWELEKGELDVSGSRLELRDVTASTSGGSEVNWWGRVLLKEGRIRNGLDARLEAECRDARPLYHLFDVKLPKWAEKFLELQNLRATSRFRLSGNRLALDGLSVTGGEFHISGEYDKRGSVAQGVFLVEQDKLAVALQIDGAKKSLRPLGAREWYAAAAAEHRRTHAKEPASETARHISGH